MICPGDFNEFNQKPSLKISWVVLFLNFFVYIASVVLFEAWPSQELYKKLNDEKFIRSVSEMYLQTMDPIEKKKINANINAIYSRALKDQKFWTRVGDYPFVGDQVQISESKKTIKIFYESYLKSPQYHFGLGALENSPWSWVTYQFAHASFLHLMGNLIIIFLIISYLEKQIPPTWIAAAYLFSGFAGGISFLYLDSVGGMSVVGASASASGLMSFLLIINSNKLMPWGFLIAPVKKGYGQIYLPVFFIFPVFLLSDFISLLWEPSGIASNVAVSAHVGGVFMGLMMGGYYLLFGSKSSTHSVFGHNDGLHELL